MSLFVQILEVIFLDNNLHPNNLLYLLWSNPQDDLNEGDEEEDEDDKSGPDFNYILGMPLWNLTKEKKELLCKQRDEKVNINMYFSHWIYGRLTVGMQFIKCVDFNILIF